MRRNRHCVSGSKVDAAKQSRAAKANAGKTRSNVGNENEIRLAERLGRGYRRLADSEPMDILYTDGVGIEHGIEVKTLLTNKHGRIHMTGPQRKRKNAWERGELLGIKNPRPRPDPDYAKVKGRRVHVVVIDHREAYYDSRHGGANFNDRKFNRFYYARGAKPWDIKDMICVTSLGQLRELQKMSPEKYGGAYKKYAGKIYGSDKPHPVVTRIVGGETLDEVKQTHQDRTEKLEKANRVLRRKLERAKDLKKQTRAARRAVKASGNHKQLKAAVAKLDKILAGRVAVRKKIENSRREVETRKRKLERTTTKLQRMQAEANGRKRHERMP